MLFISDVYIFAFLPVVLAGYLLVRRHRPQYSAHWLAAASLVFYGWWTPANLPILGASILFNFAVGSHVGRAAPGRSRTVVFALGVAANLLFLCYFKYYDFLLHDLLGLAGARTGAVDTIPLGISFFTFTQIAFLCDTWQRKAHEYGFAKYVLFVSYFPHLIAGPLLHHGEMMPQFDRLQHRRLRLARAAAGVTIFVIGLTKKVVFADRLAYYADLGFQAAATGQPVSLIEGWVAALSYALQIYFDFSGYSDMAVGSSLIFGIRLPVNFNSPYKAASIIDFWRRWHISLSRFLRDYLYVPLGGNRLGPLRRHANLMAVMLLGGLWHGAGWTFVVWGGLHGAFLVVNHAWRGWADRVWPRRGPLYRVAAWALTFACVCLAWVWFRSPDVATAVVMTKSLLGLNGLVLTPGAGLALGPWSERLAEMGVRFWPLGPWVTPAHLLTLAGLLALAALMPNSQELVGRYRPVLGARRRAPRLLAWRPTLAWGAAAAAAAVYAIVNRAVEQEFLYFQF